jgi:type I restriction enzyme S subunit
LVAGAQPNVSAKDIDAFDFSVPKDVEEQSQIGNFFRTLDRLITLYQKKIDSSKEMKKILLKNMLI